MAQGKAAGKTGAKAGSKAGAPVKGATDSFGGTIGVGGVRTIRAPWRVEVVSDLRVALVQDLQARGFPESLVDEAEIVASELVTNALRHGEPLIDGTVRMRWKVKGNAVEVEVTDGGTDLAAPRPVPPSLWTTSGRGLRIVRSIAHEWGVVEDRGGVTVWAALGAPSRRRG